MPLQEKKGIEIRRKVMGDAFVDQAMAASDFFTAPLQEFINEHAWGSVWCRDHLDFKTRSLVTLAMLTALGRTNELKGHLRGALNNGACAEEIREVLLHAAVYCGVPAAAEALKAAAVVLPDCHQRSAAG